MGIKYCADVEKQIIFVVWDGAVSADAWFEHIERLIADPLWPSISIMLIDLHTARDLTSIQEPEIEHAVALFSTVPIPLSKKRVGIVAGNAFWKSRRFGELVAPFGPSVIVFNNISTACVYLGIDTLEALKSIQSLRADMK